MNYLFFGIIVLCVTTIALVAIVAMFCYKQENIVMFLKSKTTVKKDAISSEVALDIDKANKKGK